jgi:hypothetical protein
MDALERVRSFIDGFAGYAQAEHRRVSDEQIRAFVGEALAQLPAVDVDSLDAGERTYYDRVLLRCEFINQDVFHVFDTDPTPARIEATLLADIAVVEAAAALRAVEHDVFTDLLMQLGEAFDKRDAAMRSG